MALQELLERWRQQPPSGEIDTSVRSVFGYSRNRIFRARPATASVIYPTLFAATPIYSGRDGVAGNYNGTSSGWYCSPVFSGIPGQATLLAVVRPAVADSTERTILSLSDVADENTLFRLETEGSNKYRFQIRGTFDAANITSTTSVVAGTTAVIGGVFRDSTREKSVWVNGRKEATATNNLGSGNFTRTTLGVLSRITLIHYFSGLIFEAHVLPYAASDGWMAEATRSPIALLNAIYKPRRIWVPVSAGGTPKSITASLSAAVQAGRTATASIAAAVQAGRTATASAAAAVQAGRTATASAAAAVQDARTSTASVATAIRDARTATASVAAAVQRGQTATASIAAAVQAAHTATASAAAAVQAPQTATASLTTYVQAGQTVSASLSAAVQVARAAQASIAAAVQTPRSAQASIATAVAQASTVTASLAAGIREARSASASISAQIQAGTTVVAQIQAAIREARAATASIAAAVAVARTASASLSTAVAVQRSLFALFQGAVQVGRTVGASVAAYISTPGSHTVSPRLYLVDPQDRAYLIDPEDRTYIVPASSRSTTA